VEHRSLAELLPGQSRAPGTAELLGRYAGLPQLCTLKGCPQMCSAYAVSNDVCGVGQGELRAEGKWKTR
jgi:hypothetical protein